jgi:hypothetical protein
MTMCITNELGPCCCLKARVRWCEPCKRWICRAFFDSHVRRHHA